MLAFAALIAAPVHATAIEPRTAEVIAADDALPPAEADARWQKVPLPDSQRSAVAWYRLRFDASGAAATWAVYLPFLYGGGRIWLNGEPAAELAQNSAERRVRWERPHLLQLPRSALREGPNTLLLRVASSQDPTGTVLPRLVVGPLLELQLRYDVRFFFVRTMPLVTVITGVVAGLLTLFIWWRKRGEVLYGLFGAAAVAWALRTTTFVVDTLPAPVWDAWRALYSLATGAFVVFLALFGMASAGWWHPIVVRSLLVYAAIGPLAHLFGGGDSVHRLWVAGLVPIGLTAVIVGVLAAWRQRTRPTVAIAAVMVISFAAGVHDFLLASRSPLLHAWLPDWSAHRIFLLHHAANLMLLAMGALLVVRFVQSLSDLEGAKSHLETRLLDREREIAASFEQVSALQREKATVEERQRIMRELHDGLGSQLFAALSHAEKGALSHDAMADLLRHSIAEMRLAIETLASNENDFRAVFGNFRYRWDSRLRELGLGAEWHFTLPDEMPPVPPHDALQVLRVAQEALTNVLKHAQARRVRVGLAYNGGALQLEVVDDGQGIIEATGSGRGLANMRARADRLGAALDISCTHPGTRVRLALPLGAG